MDKKQFMRLIISILICLAIGFIGLVFTTPAIPTWYENLNFPPFRPPNWIFGPVWTILYVLMGISVYLVWNLKKNKYPLTLFSIQLILNLIWSLLFFGLQNPFYALIEIIVLWIAILLTIISFYKLSKKAGLILLPYILWVTFAAILNYFIWLLN